MKKKIKLFPIVRPLRALDKLRSPSTLDQWLTSIIVQIDGLLYAVFRQRLERDVCARDLSSSFCQLWGASGSPASTFCGLYFPDSSSLAVAIEAVRKERGLGVFVSPEDSAAFKLVENSVKLEFFFKDQNSKKWRAAFVTFAFAEKVKRKKPEKRFDLCSIIDPYVPQKVGLFPFCPARVSPMAVCPDPVHDKIKASPPFPVNKLVKRPSPPKVWNDSLVLEMGKIYPCQVTANLAISAVSPGGAPSTFVGDRSKCVLAKNSISKPSDLAAVMENFRIEVAANRMIGPFTQSPFPNEWCPNQPRVVPVATRPKDKWDPLSSKIRVVTNFSKHRPSSVNDLVFQPHFLGYHLQSAHLRDALFFAGPSAHFATIDQEHAFRSMAIDSNDLHLYTYKIGDLWYVDVCNPFGARESEWRYCAAGNIIQWSLSRDMHVMGPPDPLSLLARYVDNFHRIAPASDTLFVSRWDYLKTRFAALGMPMHEEQSNANGPVKALGWEWDTKLLVFLCPLPKFQMLSTKSAEWASRAIKHEPFSFTEILSLVGIFQWLSAACPIIVPEITAIRNQRTKMEKHPQPLTPIPLDAQGRDAIVFLRDFLQTWDRSCPLFAGFSPVASWQILIRCDASTEFGAGGFILPSCESFIHKWTSEEARSAKEHRSDSKRESTPFQELLTILLMIQRFKCQLVMKRVQFECDNETTVKIMNKCFSAAPPCMKIVGEIRSLCASLYIIPRFEHILNVYNCVADALSHDDFPQAALWFKEEFGLNLLPLGQIRLG